jgi:1,4-dihydroxy-2-naphthoate octaprenyltransferase
MNIKTWIMTWLKAARAPFFIASIIPAILGGTMAYYDGSFNPSLFLIAVLGLVFVQAGADFFDDYFDFQSGNVANKDKQFFESPLLKGILKPRDVLYAGVVCLAASLGIMLYFTVKVGYPVLVLACIGGFIAFFYTSPPVKLGYRGLGEVAIFLSFGPLLVEGVYYVMTKNFALGPVIASVPLGILITNITYVGAVFDYESDRSADKRCLVVMLGKTKAVKFLALLFLLAYSTIIFGVAVRIIPIWTLLALLTSPFALTVVKICNRWDQSEGYTPAVTRTVAISTITGVLLSIGYVIPVLIS